MPEKITPNIHKISIEEADDLAGKTVPGSGPDSTETVSGSKTISDAQVSTEEVEALREELKLHESENSDDVFKNK